MSRKVLLRIAAFFTLFVFVGHTLGALKGPPTDQTDAFNVYITMSQTIMTLPFNTQRSIATLMFGANICLSVYMLVGGLFFIIQSMNKEKATREGKQILLVNSLGLLVTGVISFFVFFPLPAVCLCLSGLLGLVASRKD